MNELIAFARGVRSRNDFRIIDAKAGLELDALAVDQADDGVRNVEIARPHRNEVVERVLTGGIEQCILIKGGEASLFDIRCDC